MNHHTAPLQSDAASLPLISAAQGCWGAHGVAAEASRPPPPTLPCPWLPAAGPAAVRFWRWEQSQPFPSWLRIPGFSLPHLVRTGPELCASGSVWGQGWAGPPSLPWEPASQISAPPKALPASTSFDLITEGELISYKLALLVNSSVLSGLTQGSH